MSNTADRSSWERFPDLIRERGLRLTRQRHFLAELLFKDGRNRHVTAASLTEKAKRHGAEISLATIYNTLHQFVELGLLRQVVIDSKAAYFDTNLCDHHHFFHEETGRLMDISGTAIDIRKVPQPPGDTCIKRVDVVIHLQDRSK